MTRQQSRRCFEKYKVAADALESLAEGALNLDGDTRAALDRARGALEEFDSLRCAQPLFAEESEGAP